MIELTNLTSQARRLSTSYSTASGNQYMQKDSLLVSSSINSEYIPYYSMFMSERMKVGDNKFSIYCVPNSFHHYDTSTQTANLTKFLLIYLKDKFLPRGFTRDNRVYQVMKHMIYEEINGKVNILFCLVIREDYWRTLSDGHMDYTKLRLIISTQFKTESRKSMYTYILKYIVPHYEALGIDVIFTTDITRYSFKNFAKPVQFSSIAERRTLSQQFTQQVVNEFLT